MGQMLTHATLHSFMPIGDRFVSLLEQCTKSAATNPKEAELLAEVAIMGTRRLTITVSICCARGSE